MRDRSTLFSTACDAPLHHPSLREGGGGGADPSLQLLHLAPLHLREVEQDCVGVTSPALAEIVELAGRHRIVPLGCTPNGYSPTGQGLPWTERHVEMVDLCRAFIRAEDRPRWRRPLSSYVLKHEVERWQRARNLPLGACHYVTNGSLIIACLLEGLRPRRMWFEDHGWRLAINSMVRLP